MDTPPFSSVILPYFAIFSPPFSSGDLCHTTSTCARPTSRCCGTELWGQWEREEHARGGPKPAEVAYFCRVLVKKSSFVNICGQFWPGTCLFYRNLWTFGENKSSCASFSSNFSVHNQNQSFLDLANNFIITFEHCSNPQNIRKHHFRIGFYFSASLWGLFEQKLVSP